MELKEIYPGVIWSVQYTGDERNIFAIRMYQWRDVEYLEDFIFRHKCIFLILVDSIIEIITEKG